MHRDLRCAERFGDARDALEDPPHVRGVESPRVHQDRDGSKPDDYLDRNDDQVEEEHPREHAAHR